MEAGGTRTGLSLPHSSQRASGSHKGPIDIFVTNTMTLAFQWNLGSCLALAGQFSLAIIVRNQASILESPFAFLMSPWGMRGSVVLMGHGREGAFLCS